MADNPLASPSFLITDQGTFRLEAARLVRDANTAIRTAISSVPTLVEGAFEVGNLKVRLAVRGDGRNVTAVVQLPRIKLDTYFTLSDGYLWPSFQQHQDAVRATCEWVPPADMKVHFAAALVQDELGYWKVGNGYLFAVTGEGPRYFYRLPLANTFTDARFCLGNSARDIARKTIVEAFAATLALFDNSQWNTDLFEAAQRSRVYKLVRFDPQTRATLPPSTPWQDWCFRVGNTAIEEVCP